MFLGLKLLIVAMQVARHDGHAGEVVNLLGHSLLNIRLASSQSCPSPDTQGLLSVHTLLGIPQGYERMVNGVEVYKCYCVWAAVLKHNGVDEQCEMATLPKMSPVPHKPVFLDLAFSRIMESLP